MITAEAQAPSTRFTPNQRRGFFAAWGGVVLDGVDSFIYALVLVPALRALLPASGIEPSVGNLSFYGSILFSVFLIGWGLAFLWGPIADRFGRVRVLMLAILCYSLFTFLGALAQNWWQLAIFRLLAGFGIGGEFVGAATFVVEELPERRRVMGTGIMNSGYYVGIFIAAALNYLIGAHYGWRAMFAIGGLPALFIAYVRLYVQEPERWRKRVAETGGWRARDSFLALFSPEYRRRTLLNCVFLLISMIGLWAGSVYAPTAVTQVATRMGYNAADAARIASRATMLLATGTIIGCLVMPTLAQRFGRRGALACFYSLMAVSIAVSFGYAFYRTVRRAHHIRWLSVLRRRGRRQLRRVLDLDQRAVPHRVPRQCAGFRDVDRQVRRRRRDFPGGDRDSAIRQHRRAGGADGDSVCAGPHVAAALDRDAGQAATCLAAMTASGANWDMPKWTGTLRTR